MICSYSKKKKKNDKLIAVEITWMNDDIIIYMYTKLWFFFSYLKKKIEQEFGLEWHQTIWI